MVFNLYMYTEKAILAYYLFSLRALYFALLHNWEKPKSILNIDTKQKSQNTSVLMGHMVFFCHHS